MSSVMVTPTLAWISKSSQPLPWPARRKPSSIHGAMTSRLPGAKRSGRIPWPSSAHSRVVAAQPAGARPGIGQGDLPALVGHGRLALGDLADDLHVVPQPVIRHAPRLAVPALHDLRAGHPQAQDEAVAAGQRVHGLGLHGRHRRRAAGQLHDAGAQPDPLGLGGQVSQRRDRVRAVRLGRPDRVEAEPLRLEHALHRELESGTGVPNGQAQLHGVSCLPPHRGPPGHRSPASPAGTCEGISRTSSVYQGAMGGSMGLRCLMITDRTRACAEDALGARACAAAAGRETPG
jgi:hypothetical protein